MSIYHKIALAVLSSILLEVGFTQFTDSKYVLAQSMNNADTSCYWQTTDGRNIDLGVLCGSKSQPLPTSSSTSEQEFSIENVRLISIIKTREFYVTGNLTNRSNKTQGILDMSYQVYKQVDGYLKPDYSNNFTVEKIQLQAGETTKFEAQLRRRPTLLMFTSLDSSEQGSIPLDICYTNTVEQGELCKRLSPISIRRYSPSK
ncbi:hypothetical protein Cylst_6035 [Cylindrospermum stagnale PCC 7417]|uniref:Uncharacterized protein n=1 Tax=Cylindrospermum stagnale PCC 7417 TaxID=56107 RepID=K9X667_9NOST|nr:hypothetical protein [Cylindrospermum stagnale]AFZ28008.1 hypothetical protein Cylst_6035 [Cylindrospermum stagnale PCC 7417]